ncbi:phosphotransferase [Halonotius terrestris]|uniref:Phosphotransferase n=1 Tax=Halonotius terrestris TaxID=2487750 RepID=A0A8J8PC73_9EURY|nr:phosphotransferase [Halonotius terrestris]
MAAAFGDERARVAAAVGLDAIAESPIEIEAITRGNRKETAIARFPTRGPVVVQVSTEPTWLRTEAALLREIRQRTFVPVPPVLAAGTHDGVAYMLTAYVAGSDLHAAFAAVERETQRALARWFGRALARLHDAFAFDAYGRLELAEAGFTASQQDWPTWFADYGERAIDRLPAAFDDLAADLRDLLAEPPDSDRTPRLFPWDFRPGNALVADGSVTAVLDWEAPLSAAPALSVAKAEYLVADWYVDDPEPLRAAFREGYESIRAMPAVSPAHRAVAIAASAIDSAGRVTNPRYPPVASDAAVAFHRDALESVLAGV